MGGSATTIDEFQYHYQPNNNRLDVVEDHSGDTDYDMAGTEFGYDPTGNVISDNSDDLGTNTIVTWTPDNKLLRTLDNDNERETENLYDAMGNLVRRRSHQNWNALEVDILTFYIRDATGNVIATYEMDMQGSQSLDVKERYIYGAEKIAVLKGPNSVSGTTIDHLPQFQYLIHDHLGNQRVMVADKGSPGNIEIKSFSNMYAFGAPHPERSYNLLDARFGFNGQEKVDLIKGIGLHYNAKFWEYDAVYGRRWNLDPVVNPAESIYITNHDNPIASKDPNGDVGVVGAMAGAVAGGAVELGSQMLSNYLQGKSVWNVDWADVAISAGEGAVIGATGGASLLITKGAGATLRASIDWKPLSDDPREKGYSSAFGFFGGYSKSAKNLATDVVSEGVGLLIGGGADALGGKVSQVFGATGVFSKAAREATSSTIDAYGGGIMDAIINKGFDERWQRTPKIEIGPLKVIGIEVQGTSDQVSSPSTVAPSGETLIQMPQFKQ